MGPWLILLLVIYPVTEWFAASWLAAYVGWGGVLLVVAALFLVGLAVMRRAGFAAARSLRPVQVDGATVLPGVTPDALSRAGRDVGDAGTLFVAGVLIAVPGLVTSAVGLLLLLPPVRSLVRRRVSRSVRRRASVSGFTVETTTTTVQGTVVRDDGPRERPQIIEGEIVREDHPDD